jgi:hypothetical protein
MTTTQTPTRPELRLAGVLLLEALVERLRAVGYVKTAIDTYTDLASKHTIRHSYTGGAWTLSCGHGGGPRLEVRYSIEATMPDVDQLLNAVLPPPF